MSLRSVLRKTDRNCPYETAKAGTTANLDALSKTVERLEAVCIVQNGHIGDLQSSNAQVRAALGLDPPPPVIGANWITTKQAAGLTGYSESHIRKWIKQKRLAATKIGGRVLIDATSVPIRSPA